MKSEFVPNEMLYVKHYLIKLVEKRSLTFSKIKSEIEKENSQHLNVLNLNDKNQIIGSS
jgi:hypothetical protein